MDAVGQCKHASGIPPHIENACLFPKMLRFCEETLTTVKVLTIQVKEAVKDVFEEKAEENRQLTGERLKVMLSEYQEKLLSVIDGQISDLVSTIVSVPRKADGQELPDDFAEGMMDNHDKDNYKALVEGRQQQRLYTFGGRFWQVPEHFAFPKDAKLILGWRL